MKKIAVTGFEPFDSRNINASYEVISRLENVDKYLLPVCFNKVEEKIKAILDTKPDYLILCGEAKSYLNMTIEEEAHNIQNGTDNDGITKTDEKILDGDYTLYRTIVNDFSNIDLAYSHSAGKYLCNVSYYYALHYSKKTNTKVMFIHFPLIKEQGGNFELNDFLGRMNSIIDILD